MNEQLSLSLYFPSGSDGKESACNAGDLGSIPGLGRSPQKGKATRSSILAWRIPRTVGPWGRRELDLHFTSLSLQSLLGGGGAIAKLRLTFCHPADSSPPGSSFHGILQARILEGIAMLSCRRSSQTRN